MTAADQVARAWLGTSHVDRSTWPIEVLAEVIVAEALMTDAVAANGVFLGRNTLPAWGDG